MTKSQLEQKLAGKVGFKAIVSDKLAPDSPAGALEKRYYEVATINADGTAGIYFVYYLHDTQSDEAWFYNVEVEALDNKEPVSDQKKLNALQNYLKTNFDAFFVIRFDMTNLWAEADVFKYNATTKMLDKFTVLVYKTNKDPIKHLTIA